MTVRDAYRNEPTDLTEAHAMLHTIREYVKQGLRGDPVLDTTNSRMAYLKGYIAGATR